MNVVALIPAHNEEKAISAAVGAVLPQVQRVIVVADNCSDSTVLCAWAAGAEVFQTVANTHKKAGALNQVIASLDLTGVTHVLVVDADSQIAPDFVSRARAATDRRTGAVGGVFYGEPGHGLVGQLQRNEYVRYARDISRKQARASVLTGTATMFPVDVMQKLIASRGTFYDQDALTEDMEVTLAIKTMGYKCRSPRECWVTTEVMPTWRDLYRQRVRWTRGAFENLKKYGLNGVTLPYFGVQFVMLLGIFGFTCYIGLTAALIAVDQFEVNVFWLGIGLVFVAERVVTVWHGRQGRLLALSFFPELVYDLVQQAIYIRCALDTLFGRAQHWHHVGR